MAKDSERIISDLRKAARAMGIKGEYASAREWAVLLGTTPKQLQRAEKKGLLHPLKLTGSRKGRKRYSVTDVAAWLAHNAELASADV